MLILLLSPQDRDDPKLGPWMSDLSQSNDVVVALYDHKNPNQIEQLFATAEAAGIPVEKISAADPAKGGVTAAAVALSGKIAELSRRQRDVLVLVADGLSNKLIAIQTGATLTAVQGDMKKIFRILGVKNRTAAALLQSTAALLQSTQAPALPKAAVKPRHILLAEDDRATQTVIALQLRTLGYEVDIAADGFEAVQAVQDRDYDVVLMDIQMPRMNGMDAMAAIRSLEGPRARIPIVAISAHAEWKDRQRFLDAGMDDYLPKPATRADFASMLAKVATR